MQTTIAQRLASKLRVISKADADKLLEITVLELQANTKEDFVKLENKIKKFKSGFALSEEEWLSDVENENLKLETIEKYEGETKQSDLNEIIDDLGETIGSIKIKTNLIYNFLNRLKPISPTTGNPDNTIGYNGCGFIGDIKTQIEHLKDTNAFLDEICKHLIEVVGE